MLKVKEREIRKIKKEIEKEFPYDFPLQEIHICQKNYQEGSRKKWPFIYSIYKVRIL